MHTITGVATSIALFIGWAARGPTDKAVRIASFADYERTYGGLDQRTLLGYTVQQFFGNGGSDVYVTASSPWPTRGIDTGGDRRDRHRRRHRLHGRVPSGEWAR